MSSSSWKDEARKRMAKVVKLNEECAGYIALDKDALANQILGALLKVSSRTDAPVKLSEIAEALYGASEKSKQDIVRLTIEKTLLKCGIVEKIYFTDRDVRYFPTAYRFQEIRRIENSAGQKIDQLIGGVVELPRKYWPIPHEFYDLTLLKVGYEDALSKLERDRAEMSVDSRNYSRIKARLEGDLETVTKKLREYEGVDELITG